MCKFTLSILLLFNISGGELLRNLLEKIMSLDFEELKVTFHFCAQFEIFSKSLFKICAVSAGSDPVANKEVSSAKIKYHYQFHL